MKKNFILTKLLTKIFWKKFSSYLREKERKTDFIVILLYVFLLPPYLKKQYGEAWYYSWTNFWRFDKLMRAQEVAKLAQTRTEKIKRNLILVSPWIRKTNFNVRSGMRRWRKYVFIHTLLMEFLSFLSIKTHFLRCLSYL